MAAAINDLVQGIIMLGGIIVVVVSADTPVFIIQGGVQLNAACDLHQEGDLDLNPPALETWLEEQ